MDPLWESWSQLKVGLKRGMSHSPLYPHFNPTLKLALIPVRGLWIRAQDLTICLHQRVLNAFLQRTRLSWDRKIRLLPHPFPPPPISLQQDISLSQSSCVSPLELSDWSGRQGGGRGAESINGEKTWSSINHSILSDLHHCIPSDLWRKKYSS